MLVLAGLAHWQLAVLGESDCLLGSQIPMLQPSGLIAWSVTIDRCFISKQDQNADTKLSSLRRLMETGAGSNVWLR